MDVFRVAAKVYLARGMLRLAVWLILLLTAVALVWEVIRYIFGQNLWEFVFTLAVLAILAAGALAGVRFLAKRFLKKLKKSYGR